MKKLLIAPNAPSVVMSALETGAVSPARAGDEHSVDVVVIGTGAGGAVAGTALAKAGQRVLFLEAGGAFAQPDFQRKSLRWSTRHLYAQRGPQTTTGDITMVIPQGRTVGGSTVLNSGICFRPPAARLHEWASAVGDPRLELDALAPFVDEIWRRIGVTATHAGNGRTHNLLFQRGIEKLAAAATDGARFGHAFMDRNAPTCLGCGVCHLGCPSGAKASVDKSILPEAVNAGARVLFRCRAEGIVVQGGRAVGVDAVAVDEETDRALGPVRIKADRIIVAGSALGSPLLLERSGVGGAHVGEHLSLHPGFGVIAEFDEDVRPWDGVPQGYWAHAEGDPRFVLETQGLGPTELFGLLGKAEQPQQLQRLRHFALAGAMIRDSGGGRVRLKDSVDAPFAPAIEVRFTPADLDAFKAGGAAVVRAYFAAGARRVAPFSTPFAFFDREADALAALDAMTSVRDILQVHASHPMGTCRMSSGIDSGVVDGNGKVHGVDGLWVMDGSIFPSALGVNPQVTIMALSLSLAQRLTA